MSNYGNYNDGNYQQSNYNANGGYNSGGFVASQGTPGTSDRKSSSNNALRPVRISEILEATQSHPDADFKIDNVEIGALTFCGRVVNVSSAATNTTYQIDDGTGSIEVKQWVDADRATQSEIRQDSSVRCHGTLKSFNQKRHVGLTCIKLITDEKELKYHELECQYVSLYVTRGPLGESGANNTTNMDGTTSDVGQSELAKKLNVLDPFSRRVMEAIHGHPESNEGINVRALQSMVGGGETLFTTIESLKEDGHLYTTIDEDHVKSTMI